MKSFKIILIAGLFVLLVSFSWAETYYVDVNNGDNSAGDGSSASPWKTIAYGLNQVSSGDTLKVLPGTYSVGNGETFPLTIAKQRVILSGSGYKTTTLYGDSQNTVVRFATGGGNSTIEGFTIKGAGTQGPNSFIIFGLAENITVFQNFISGESAQYGMAFNNNGIVVKNNIIVNCGVGIFGVGFLAENNTIYNFNIGIFATGEANAIAKNNILAKSHSQGTPGGNPGFGLAGTVGAGYGLTSTYNLFHEVANPYYEGGGISTISNKSEDKAGINPYFVNTDTLDFRLQSINDGYLRQSPAIDAGDPSSDYSNEPSPNGSCINLGAFGNTAYAEKSATPLEPANLPSAPSLSSAVVYPTPYRPLSGGNATVAYTLTATPEADINIYIYSPTGQLAWNQRYTAGSNGARWGYNAVTFNGKNNFGEVLGNGIYLFRIIAGTRQIAKGYMVVAD